MTLVVCNICNRFILPIATLMVAPSTFGVYSGGEGLTDD